MCYELTLHRGCGSSNLGLYHDDIGSAEREGTDEGSMVCTFR